MSTNAIIAMKDDVGNIYGIYNHWDGYPEYVGIILATYYTEPETIQALLNEGNVSSLGASIGCRHEFDAERVCVDGTNLSAVCTFYRRDRAEYGNQHSKCLYDDRTDLASDIEYAYLFDRGEWYVHGANDESWTLLSTVLAPEAPLLTS